MGHERAFYSHWPLLVPLSVPPLDTYNNTYNNNIYNNTPSLDTFNRMSLGNTSSDKLDWWRLALEQLPGAAFICTSTTYPPFCSEPSARMHFKLNSFVRLEWEGRLAPNNTRTLVATLVMVPLFSFLHTPDVYTHDNTYDGCRKVKMERKAPQY